MKCTGLIFKAHTSIFYNEKKYRIESKFQLRLMKRMSCKCDECDEVFKKLANDKDLFECNKISKMMPLELMESPNTFLIARHRVHPLFGTSDISFKVLSETPKNIIRSKNK